MLEYPEFHGDTPLYHPTKKEEKPCKCGTSCHCTENCDCDSCGCLVCSPVQKCGCKWNECVCNSR